MNVLYLIPARGNSKGIPNKNIKLLQGKPLIYYTLEVAKDLTDDSSICVTTDDESIISKVVEFGLSVPFTRPVDLAADTSGMDGVILHALDYYDNKGINYDTVVLLQPTSPLKKAHHVKEALALYNDSLDMIVSVSETDANPYYVLFEENSNGFLRHSKEVDGIHRRQDAPHVYQYNGAIFVINAQSLRLSKSLSNFKKVKKYIMHRNVSVDIDNQLDWGLCEYILNNKLNEQ